MDRITRKHVDGAYGAFIRTMKFHGVETSGYRLDYAAEYGGYTVTDKEGSTHPIGMTRHNAREMVAVFNAINDALWQVEKAKEGAA